MVTFEDGPNPSQTTSSGAIATLGTACSATSSGSSASRIRREAASRPAVTTAAAVARPNPARVCQSVMTVCSSR